MAVEAYPSVPLFRYPWTDLTEAQIRAKLAPAAVNGPGSKSELVDLDARESDPVAPTGMRFVGDGGERMAWGFAPGRQVMFPGKNGRYGALDIGRHTLIAFVEPDSTNAKVIVWNRDTRLATVVELWFGGGPAPRVREINRAITHGYIQAGDRPGPTERHTPTIRMEGRAYAWTEDTGLRTVEYYCSYTYTHWSELDRLKDGRGYSAPADYIQLTEDEYLFARVEAEFSGMLQLYLLDSNRLESVGVRLGFNAADELEFYMFRGTAEWLGQNARFQKLGDFSAAPIPIENAKKGERRIYRPLATMDKMTPAEIDASVAAGNVHVFDRPSAMAGNGTPTSAALAGKAFSVRYDDGPAMEYRFNGPDSLNFRKDGQAWIEARYNAWEPAPGVFIFGHLLPGERNHDCHIVVADLDAGLATNYHGFVNTPYIANEAGVETLFGKVIGEGIPDPGRRRHERTRELLGRAFTWEYSPGLNSMHLYSTPNTTSWIIPNAATGHFGTEWSGSGDFVKIREQLYFVRWCEEACNGTLGTLLLNMRTMHDAGIGYHMGKTGGLSLSAVGAPARHAGKFDVDKYFAHRGDA